MWIARNKDGSLVLFEGRPHRMDKDSVVPEEYKEGYWAYYTIHSVIGPHTIQHFSSKMLNSELFPELKWEDEPIEVELVPKGSRIDYLGNETKIERAEEIWTECKI